MSMYEIENGKVKKVAEISNPDLLREYYSLNERKARLQNRIINYQKDITAIELQLTNSLSIIEELGLDLETNQEIEEWTYKKIR